MCQFSVVIQCPVKLISFIRDLSIEFTCLSPLLKSVVENVELLKYSSMNNFRFDIVSMDKNISLEQIVKSLTSFDPIFTPYTVILDFNCPQSQDFVTLVGFRNVQNGSYCNTFCFHLKCSTSQCFLGHFRWLIFEQTKTGSNLLPLLEAAPLLVDAEIAYVNLGKTVDVTEKYRKYR